MADAVCALGAGGFRHTDSCTLISDVGGILAETGSDGLDAGAASGTEEAKCNNFSLLPVGSWFCAGQGGGAFLVQDQQTDRERERDR